VYSRDVTYISSRMRHSTTHQSTSHVVMCAIRCTKYPHNIRRYFVARFPYLTEPVPYTLVSVNRRNDEARAHVAGWTRALLFRRFTDKNVSARMWKTRHKISADIQKLFAV